MQAQPTHKQHGHFVGLQAPTRPPLRTRGLIGCEILCRNAQGNHGRHGALRLDLNAQSSSQPLCLRLPHLVHRLVHALRGADQRVSDCERPLHVVGDLRQHARRTDGVCHPAEGQARWPLAVALPPHPCIERCRVMHDPLGPSGGLLHPPMFNTPHPPRVTRLDFEHSLLRATTMHQHQTAVVITVSGSQATHEPPAR